MSLKCKVRKTFFYLHAMLPQLSSIRKLILLLVVTFLCICTFHLTYCLLNCYRNAFETLKVFESFFQEINFFLVKIYMFDKLYLKLNQYQKKLTLYLIKTDFIFVKIYQNYMKSSNQKPV